jgi:hypothetical protein
MKVKVPIWYCNQVKIIIIWIPLSLSNLIRNSLWFEAQQPDIEKTADLFSQSKWAAVSTTGKMLVVELSGEKTPSGHSLERINLAPCLSSWRLVGFHQETQAKCITTDFEPSNTTGNVKTKIQDSSQPTASQFSRKEAWGRPNFEGLLQHPEDSALLLVLCLRGGIMQIVVKHLTWMVVNLEVEPSNAIDTSNNVAVHITQPTNNNVTNNNTDSNNNHSINNTI